LNQTYRFIIEKTWKLTLSDLGLSPANVLSKAKLPADLLIRKSASVSIEEYFSLWNAMDALLGNENLALKLGQNISVESFIPPLFASFCSPNLNICLERQGTYKRLIGPMVFRLFQKETETVLEIECPGTGSQLPRSIVAFEMVFLTKLARTATREKIKPLSVTTSFVMNSKPYRKFFGIVPKKGKVNQIVFSRADAQLPFLTNNEKMWNFFEPGLQKRLSELDVEATFSSKVRGSLIEMLPGGLCCADDVADRLGVSKRTLQRNLNKEETTFQKQLNYSRELLARHYLANSELTSSEIAFLIGYDDPNSFIRAFHVWTGKTPESVRRETV